MSENDDTMEERDPAAEAFSRLEGEIALMRRAAEQMAAEKANITIPDYSATLGEMSQRLNSAAQTLQTIVGKPAMDLTPESMAQRIDHAARQARQTDQKELRSAQDRCDSASRDLRGLIATAQTAHEQRRHLVWAAGGGLLTGCLLWSIMPGVILRALPASWHMPESMATHIIGEPSLWEAGIRLMQAESPQAWQAIADAAKMRRDNRETIASCEKAALDAKRHVRCTIKVGPPQI